MPRSAVIIPVELPRPLHLVRNAGDVMAAHGVPPHVTILFPFIPPASLTPDVQTALAAIAASTPAFTARFERVERRDGIVWLVPDDQEPFLRLTGEVAARWPDHQPYGGVHPELIAHLTVVESHDLGALDEAERAATNAVPLDGAADELRVIAEDEAGGWRDCWRIPLGA